MEAAEIFGTREIVETKQKRTTERISIVYLSPNGSTGEVAAILSEELTSIGNVKLINLADYSHLEGYREIWDQLKETSILGIGSPVYHLSMVKPIRHFLQSIHLVSASSRNLRKAFCFTTFGHVNSGKTLSQMCRLLKQRGFEILGALKLSAPHFFDERGEFPSIKDKRFIANFCSTIIQRSENPIKWELLERKLDYLSLKVKFLYPFVRAFEGMTVPKIRFEPNLCNACGRCESACPVHVISIQDLPKKQKGCINCFNCVMVCPTGAMNSDIERAKNTVRFNKRVVGGEPPQEFF